MFDPLGEDNPVPEDEYEDAADAAWDRCIDNRNISLVDAIALVAPLVCSVIAIWIGDRVATALGWNLPGFLVVIPMVVLYGFSLWLFYGNRYKTLLIDELRSRGYKLCTRCGYHRAGLAPDERCPECGGDASPVP